MFCPNCSNEIFENGTQFCSRCGFTTKNIKQFLQTGGEIEDSKQQKGIKQGVKLIALSLILLPAFILLNSMFPPNDVLVESSPSNTWFEQIGWAVFWTILLAGVARIAFSLAFERESVHGQVYTQDTKQVTKSRPNNSLPPMQDNPISNFGKWKTTDELFEPIFVKQKTSGELK